MSKKNRGGILTRYLVYKIKVFFVENGKRDSGFSNRSSHIKYGYNISSLIVELFEYEALTIKIGEMSLN